MSSSKSESDGTNEFPKLSVQEKAKKRDKAGHKQSINVQMKLGLTKVSATQQKWWSTFMVRVNDRKMGTDEPV